MRVVAIYTYDVDPGELPGFMAWVGRATARGFAGRNTHETLRFAVHPGEIGATKVTIEYDYAERAAYDARVAFEREDPGWNAAFPQGDVLPWRVTSVVVTEVG